MSERSIAVDRRLIVRIVGGVGRGLRRELAPGELLLIGRARDAPLSISDPGLSRRHFELEFDGVVGRLRDLDSANGTRVNGLQVVDALLRDGDRIEAGDTVIEIALAAPSAPAPAARSSALTPRASTTPTQRPLATVPATSAAAALVLPEVAQPPDAPPPQEPPTEIYENVEPVESLEEAPEPAPGSAAHGLCELFANAQEGQLYAIVDGALAVETALAARVQGHKLYTLFSGDMAKHAAHAGPILIPIVHRKAFLAKWAETLGKNGGVLLEAAVELEPLYAQLRHIFVVKDEEGQESLVRFYDPRVLRVLLPIRTADERGEFFGSIVRFVSEDEKGEGFEEHTRDLDARVELGPFTPAPSSSSSKCRPARG